MNLLILRERPLSKPGFRLVRTGSAVIHAAPKQAQRPNVCPVEDDFHNLKRWEAGIDLEAPDLKKVTVIKDGEGNVVDYRGVTIEGYLSTFKDTTEMDRQGDYVEPGAFTETLKKFMLNPVMLTDHQNKSCMLAGKFVEAREDRRGLFVRGILSDAPGNADTRFKVAEGMLKTLSMGGLFHYNSDGRGIFKVDLWEGSLTPIPANPDACVSVRALNDTEKHFVKTMHLWRSWGHFISSVESDAKYNADQPREEGGPDGGQWTSGGGGGEAGSGLSIKPNKTRAWAGEPVASKVKLSKLETGSIGEQVTIAYLKSQGFKDARTANIGRNNFPFDVVQNHDAIEVKSGLASNGKSAQQWRATIGQPGAKESAWLAKASKEDKAAWNAKKAQMILKRKEEAVRNVAKELKAKKMGSRTIATIINPDTKTVDLYEFKGFHLRIPWGSKEAQAAYRGSFKYAR